MPNAATREVHNAATGARLTLPQAHALLRDPPAGMTDRQKRRLADWVAKRDQATRNRQRERYDATVELLTNRREQLADDLDTLTEWAEDIKEDLENGRTTSQKAQDMLTRIFRAISQVRERIDGTRADDDAAWAMVSADPADFEHDQLQRFPSLRQTMPMLSRADLDGRD